MNCLANTATARIITRRGRCSFMRTSIDLYELDGDGFEKLCAEIFRRHCDADVEVTPYANDKGKDIIIRKDGSTIFVECKLWWTNSIGRPVVQKLDSAVHHEGADLGVIVTTSSFTRQAIAYAQECNPPIRLVGLGDIQRMAESVGYDLYCGDEGATVEYWCSMYDDGDLRGRLAYYLDLDSSLAPSADPATT